MKPTWAALAVWQAYGRTQIGLYAAWHWEWTLDSFGNRTLALRLP